MSWVRLRNNPQICPDALPSPWAPTRENLRTKVGAVGKAEGFRTFKKWYNSRHLLDLFIFSDGALIKDQAGAGYSIRRDQNCEVEQGNVPLGQSAEVNDAAIVGATEGLAAAIRNPMSRYATNITICLENEEKSIRLSSETATATSSLRIKKFQKLVKAWPKRDRSQFTNPGEVSICWCPSHTGITGNEKADFLAKAAYTDPSPLLPITIARARRKVKENYENSVAHYWAENAPCRYKELQIGPNTKATKELANLNRRSLGYLLVARSGHGDFADHHRCFEHGDSLLRCPCGREKSQAHFLYCHLGRRRAHIKDGPTKTNAKIKWVLGTSTGAFEFNKWIKDTVFFEQIQKRS